MDNAAFALESKAFYVRKVGSDGFQIRYQPTLKKAVSDRRASLDDATEVQPAMRTLVEKEFRRGANVPLVAFPEDGATIQDSPKLTFVVLDPTSEWTAEEASASQIVDWTKHRGTSPRLYPGSLIWCLKKPGNDLRQKTELWLAWKRVAEDINQKILGGDFDKADLANIQSNIVDTEDAAKDEVWGGYRYALLADSTDPRGLKVIDLGAGHSNSGETLCGRVIAALKSQALLNETVGAGYLERNWPPALKQSGAWPLTSLRQSFLNGSLTRLLDSDTVLKKKIVEFVGKEDFGLASGPQPDGSYEHLWHGVTIQSEEVVFENGVFLLTKSKAEALRKPKPCAPKPPPAPPAGPTLPPGQPVPPEPGVPAPPEAASRTFRISGSIPPEIWNRLGTRVIPKLRAGTNLQISVEFAVTIDKSQSENFQTELRQILQDLGLGGTVTIS